MKLPEITELRRLRLEPGDSLVLTVDAVRLDMATAEALKDRTRAALGVDESVPVMVMEAGTKLEVVSHS